MRIRRAIACAAGAALLGVVATGCGGTDTTASSTVASERQAAMAGETFTCPEADSSTWNPTIINYLPVPITLRAREYSCDDWSGTSTPGRAFSGKVLQPGERRAFTLEARIAAKTREWTMEIMDGATSLGTARMLMSRGTSGWITIRGAETVYRPAGVSGDMDVCTILPMEPTRFAATQWSSFRKKDLLVVSRDGRTSLASRCS